MSISRSILIFLGALVFSALLWAYVRLSAPYEADVDLPAKLTAPKGYALETGLPQRLHVRVRGAGWQILLMNFAKNSRFQFDLGDRAVSEAVPLVMRNDEISNAVMMPSELRVLKVEPDSLQLRFSKRVQKQLTIVPRLDVQPGNGYVIIGAPTVNPRSILVEGSESVLDSISYIPTSLVIEHGAKDDVEQTVALSDSLDNLLTIPNPPKVVVRVNVEAIGERVLSGVPVNVEALPPQFDLLLIPNTVSVTLRGGVDALAKLPANALRARVAYNPVYFDTAKTIVPQFEIPGGFTLLSEEPSRIKFILRRKAGVADAHK